MDKTILIVLTILYILAIFYTIRTLYQGNQTSYVIKKCVSSLLFLAIGFTTFQISDNELYFQMLPGFLLCFCGDVLLALAHEIDNKLKNPQFSIGVGCFLFAHVAFCIAFAQILEYRFAFTNIIAVVTVVVTVSSIRSPKYDYGSNKIPSAIYSFFVGLLCGMGLNLLWVFGFTPKTLCLALGSVLFLGSDYMLSNKYFKKKVPHSIGCIVLVAYYGALYLLSISVLF